MQSPVPYKGTDPYIFVSYSHRDGEAVQKIIARMQRDGYRIWFDLGIDPGTEWDQYIAQKVVDCGYMGNGYVSFDLQPGVFKAFGCSDCDEWGVREVRYRFIT